MLERNKDRIKSRERKNKERNQLHKNLSELHSKLDTTKLTNYDNPLGSLEAPADLSKVSESTPNVAATPTPLDKDSTILSSLYQTFPDVEEKEEKADTENKPPEEEKKEVDKKAKVGLILGLEHDKNTIDQLQVTTQSDGTSTLTVKQESSEQPAVISNPMGNPMYSMMAPPSIQQRVQNIQTIQHMQHSLMVQQSQLQMHLQTPGLQQPPYTVAQTPPPGQHLQNIQQSGGSIQLGNPMGPFPVGSFNFFGYNPNTPM